MFWELCEDVPVDKEKHHDPYYTNPKKGTGKCGGKPLYSHCVDVDASSGIITLLDVLVRSEIPQTLKSA